MPEPAPPAAAHPPSNQPVFTDKWQWTSKLPALLAGLILLLSGLYLAAYARAPRSTIVASLAILAGLGLLYWSSAVAGWCAPPNRAFGQLSWATGLWHEPSLGDCFKLTRR